MLPMMGQAVISRMRAEKSSNDETNGRLEARENKPNPQEMTPAQKQEQARIANEELQKKLFKNMAFPIFLGAVVTTLLAVAPPPLLFANEWLIPFCLSASRLRHSRCAR